jgi:hypothetical protein
MQQVSEAKSVEAVRPYNAKAVYRAGLTARMREYARGKAHLFIAPTFDDPTAGAFAEGYADADDDSDEPRPDDENALRAVAALIYAELERVEADVSAWPEYDSGRIRMVDDIVDDVYEPEALLAILRSVEAGAGTDAMWSAAMQARAGRSAHTP